MFLNRLDLIEKEAFIGLAVNAAEANGEFTDEEYRMIEEYCKEMGIAFFDARNIMPMDRIIEIYSDSTDQVKKIVMLEVVGLMNADGGYDEKEREFVNTLSKSIGVSDESIKKIEDTLSKYIDMTRELVDCIE